MLKPVESFHLRYIHASYLLTISGGTLIVAVLFSMFLLYPGGYPDPFLPYQTIQLGQKSQVIESYPCRMSHLSSTLHTQICNLATDDEPVFSGIVIRIFDGAIQEIVYFGDTLQVVDLVQHLGKPKLIISKQDYFVLEWESGTVALVPQTARRFNYQLRVLYLKRQLMDCTGLDEKCQT